MSWLSSSGLVAIPLRGFISFQRAWRQGQAGRHAQAVAIPLRGFISFQLGIARAKLNSLVESSNPLARIHLISTADDDRGRVQIPARS